MVAVLAALGVAGVVVFAISRKSDVDDKTATLPPVGTVTAADAQVEITTCVVDEAGDPVASGTLINNAADTSNYLVSVSFGRDDTRFDLVVAPLEGVESQAEVEWTATSFADFDGDFTCAIERVERADTSATAP